MVHRHDNRITAGDHNTGWRGTVVRPPKPLCAVAIRHRKAQQRRHHRARPVATPIFWPHLLETTVPTESTGQRRQSFLAMGLQLDPAATGANGGANGALRSKIQRPLYLLLGIVALILLVVCVNLASLTLARASYRRQEISTRIALGASPWQAVRQFLVETLFLSGTGALLALLLSYWGSRFLVFLMTRNQTVPVLLDIRPDWRVFCFAAATAVLTGSSLA